MRLFRRAQPMGNGAVVQNAANCPLRQTVTPTLAAVQLDVWFHPSFGANRIFQLVVGGTTTGAALGYKAAASLTGDSQCAGLYTDAACKKTAGSAIVLPWAKLLAGKTYYYKGTAEGTTTFTLTLGPSADDRVIINGPVSQTVTVKEANVVTPKIELEYKVALLDRNLTAAAGEPVMKPPPTLIEVSIEESRAENDRAFTRVGKLTGGEAAVATYPDLLCANPVINRAPGFPAADLRTIKRIYFRGTAAGKFKLKLELEAGDDPDRVRLKPPVEMDFGVVEVKLEVHWFDDGASRPAAVPRTKHNQLAMTDVQKTETGRLLHLQNNYKDHTRAKIVLKKLVAAQWPSGCDDYDIVLNSGQRTGAGAGMLAIFSNERGGTDKTFPTIACKKSKLTEDKIFWVEGSVGSDVIRSLTLDSGIDRADGGLPKTAKRYADWARFTVIEITEIKPSELTEASGLVLVEDKGGSYEAFINLRNDGRRIKLKAKIAPVLPNIKLYFRWFRDKDNNKEANHGVDLPGSWDRKKNMPLLNAIDKANPADVKHLSVQTTALGEAEIEVKLSQFGGDKLKLGAYLDQDPIHGQWKRDDSSYNKQKPVRSVDIEVWRKFWYQIVSVPGFNDRSADVDAKRAVFERVKVRFVAAPAHNVNLAGAPQHSWPKGQVVNGGGAAPALVLHGGNTPAFLAGIVADPTMPIKVPILVCDAQWDAKGVSAALNFSSELSSFPLEVSIGELTLDPPLQGGALLVSGTFEAVDETTNPETVLATGAIAAGDISISNARTSFDSVQLALPAACAGFGADTAIRVNNLSVQSANGVYLGEYSPAEKRVLAVYDPLQVDDFGDTIVHELGHAFYQTPDAGRDPAVTPAHKYAVNAANQGTHCRNKNIPLVGHYICVMYDSGPMPDGLHRYCEYCHPYLLVQKMEALS